MTTIHTEKPLAELIFRVADSTEVCVDDELVAVNEHTCRDTRGARIQNLFNSEVQFFQDALHKVDDARLDCATPLVVDILLHLVAHHE